MDETSAPVLRQALALLNERGWSPGNKPHDDELCAQEAIRLAAGGMRLDSGELNPAFYAAREHILAIIGRKSLTWWNDEDGRNLNDVLAAFEAAIKRADV